MGNKVFDIGIPLPEDKLDSLEIYDSVKREAYMKGVLSREEMLKYLENNGIIPKSLNIQIDLLNKKIDNLKEDMYRKYRGFMSKSMEKIRKSLGEIIKSRNNLFFKLHAYDSYTCEGLAEEESFKFLVGRSIHEDVDGLTLNEICNEYIKCKLTEIDIRNIAKMDKWRAIWKAGKYDGVFGKPSCYLSDEQKSLIGWSKLYDSVYEHTNRPPDEVINDDDLLDGWLIVQHKKDIEERNKHDDDSDVGESYIMAETKQDADRIERMNTISASFVKRQRMAALKKKGVINEKDLPDVRQTIATKAIQQSSSRIRSK